MSIVNDYEVVVRGVAGMLADAPQIRVVEIAVDLPPTQPVDIVLYDTFSNTQAGEKDVDELVAKPHVGHVVIYSWNAQAGLLAKAKAQVVDGYVSKAATGQELVDAIVRVHAGDRVFPEAVDRVDDHTTSYPGAEYGLTSRESEVIALIAQGLSNEEIARRAYVSINSVKSYIRTAYRKIGVQRRSQAVLWALEHGFVRRPVREVARD